MKIVRHILLFTVFIFLSCNTLSHVELEVIDKGEWEISITEYDLNNGYLQFDNIYRGYGNSVVYFNQSIPQYLYVCNLTKDSKVTIYKVYKDGTRENVSERMSTGAVEWWHILYEVHIEDL